MKGTAMLFRFRARDSVRDDSETLLMFFRGNPKRRLKHYRHEEEGAVTVEAVLWVPVFFAICLLAVDATSLMSSQTRMWTVASDTSRLVALGRMSTADAKTYAQDLGGSSNYSVDVTSDGTTVTTAINVPFSSVPGTGFLTSLTSNLTTSATYRIEPSI